ncbi:MAG TPA: carboxypeptidase-like regulatory domain-containing protein [Vicinamibacterales bacterium]|nr:carboxypeptidase-like regulatory domain-containing protein [Vicinamibacterales bacterium]
MPRSLLSPWIVVVLFAASVSIEGDQQPRAAASSSEGATVSGVVVAMGSESPVRGAHVSLVGAGTRRANTAITDERGGFLFSGVAPGTYAMTVSKPGFVAVSYGELRPGSGRGASHIHLAPAQRFNARLSMPKGSVLTGKVVDEKGEVVARTAVRATRVETQMGRRIMHFAGHDQTDDRGIYRIYGLTPGQYVVSVTPTTDSAPLERSVKDATEDEGFSGYAPVYYPGSTTVTGAQMITLGPAQEQEALDFQLELVPLVYVEGEILGAVPDSNTEVALVNVAERAVGVSAISVPVSQDGYFYVPHVRPGQYTLLAHSVARSDRAIANSREVGQVPAQPKTRWGSADITVSTRHVKNVVVSLAEGMNVSGSIRYLSSKPHSMPIELTRARVTLVPASGGRGSGELARQVSARVDADGTFRIIGVSPGKYRLVALTEGSWTLQSAVINGQDTLDFPVDVQPGQNLSDALVTFVDTRTEVAGRVLDERGAPSLRSTAVLYAADRRYWTSGSRRILFARPSTDGQFVFRDVPPGDYRIAAVVDPDPDAVLDSRFLDQLEPHARLLTISDGERQEHTIRSSPHRQ